nr:hypothetical protein [Tanacetum cinerariifolium]
MEPNIDFFGSDQIQTPQYPDVHPPKAKDLISSLGKKITIQYSKHENPNELFQKLLEDLKEMAEYEEYFENSSKEIAVSNSNQEKEEPPQNFDIRQLIREECCVEVSEEQKQKIEDTILELVKICRQKELLCIYDNVDDLIESALNTKLLLINSQRLEKEKQEVKEVGEQPAERGNLAPILSTREPEYSSSMGYENSNTTPETESDEIIKSGVEELVPILSENEVTSEDKRECDVLVCEDSSASDVCDDHSENFFDSKNDDDISVYDDDFEDVEYVEASLSDPEIINVEEENDVEEEEIENFLNDDSIPIRVENYVFNMDEDILFLEGLLSEDPSPPPPMIPNQTKSSIKEPEHSFSMGYEHFSTTLVTNEVAESSTKNLVPIPRECEVTSDNESEYIDLVKDDSSAFTTFPNPLFHDKDDVAIHDEDVLIEESKVHSNPLFDNDEINFVELESHDESNVVESLSTHDALIDSSQKFDNLDEFFGPLIPIHIAEEERIRKEHAEYISCMEMLFTINPRPRPMVNVNTIFESLPSLPFPDQDSDSQREEIDIVTETDDVLPPNVESDDDSEGEINVVEALLINDSIPFPVNESFDFEDDPSIPRPPPEPPDAEFNFDPNSGEVISVVMKAIDEPNEDESFDPGGKIVVSTKDEDVDYFSFMFVMQIFLPFLNHPEVSPLFLYAESEETIFDPGISI